MSEHTIEQLARIGHGAIQIEEAKERPHTVFLAGPIKHWWTLPEDQWLTGDHKAYVDWRDAVETRFVQSGFLVFRPYAAWRGSWHDDAEAVNLAAVLACRIIVDITPKDIPAIGTRDEVGLAKKLNKAVFTLPPGTLNDIDLVVEEIKGVPATPPPDYYWDGEDGIRLA